MKKTLKIIILSYGTLFSQNEELSNTKYQFAKEVFENHYEMTTYEKFDGKISVVNENTIRFDEKTLIFFENSKDEYLVIFIKGLFIPILLQEILFQK